MINIAVLLTCHNRKLKTLSCLLALHACDIPKDYEFEVFLVDDGSTDGTSEAVAKAYPHVQIIYGTGFLYWNRGMHLAWERAREKRNYDFYIWLNDDTILHRTAISLLLDLSDQLKDSAIVVGTTSSTETGLKLTYGGRNQSGEIIAPGEKPKFCNHFNGNLVLIPKNIFYKLGTNDPYFHHAFGDFDYGLRASKAGIKSVIAPGVLGICEEHDKLPTWCNPEVKFKNRWKAFHTPLGNNPNEQFVFENRHKEFSKACFHYLTNHLRVFFPWLWVHTNL